MKYKKHNIIYAALVITLGVISICFYYRFTQQKNLFEELWLDTNDKMYYNVYIYSRGAMFLSLIYPASTGVPIINLIYMSILKKMKKETILKRSYKIIYVLHSRLGLIIAITATIFMNYKYFDVLELFVSIVIPLYFFISSLFISSIHRFYIRV